jgi:MFS family permease
MNDVNLKARKLSGIMGFAISIITFIVFVGAMFAVPISGANAPNGGISYPYLETIKQYPRDYIWQMLAIIQLTVFIIFYYLIQKSVDEKEKISAQIGFIFGIISSIILISTYYVQINVIPVSLMNNEKEGIALLTQYNPHGIFIALEELGYIFMLLSLGMLTFVFKEKWSMKIINFIAFMLGIILYIAIVIIFGLDKKDRFETIIISIDWICLIIDGILIGRHYKTSRA